MSGVSSGSKFTMHGRPSKTVSFGTPTVPTFKHILKGEDPFRMFLVGMSGSGKSTTIKKLVREVGDNFAYIALFGSNSKKEEYIKKKYRAIGYTEESLNKLWDIHKRKPIPALWIFDDIASENFNSKWWQGFITSCRHQGISIIFSVQSFKSVIPPALRNNMNYCIFTHADNTTVDNAASLLNKMKKEQLKSATEQIRQGKVLVLHREAFAENEFRFLTVEKE